MTAVFLVNGQPHRLCDCSPYKGDCPKGVKRTLATTDLSRCLVPAHDVMVALNVTPESVQTFAPPPAMVRAALLVLLGHVDPGWDNCKWVVQAWLDGKLDPNTPPAEAPPGYRTGKRRLIYNKLTKQIDVVTNEGFVVDSFDPPQEAG